jgi:hypothetical protein
VDNKDNMIERVLVTKVANGHVIQIKLVGISTELTFVNSCEEDLTLSIGMSITKALGDKL